MMRAPTLLSLSSLLTWLILSVTFCITPALSAPPVKVVATFSILGDIVASVGGERVSVKTLVGPDGDGHVYEPTPADARILAEAGLVVVNGLGFEGWMDRLVKSSGYKGKVAVASEGVRARPMPAGHDHGHGHGREHEHERKKEKTRREEIIDPHAWQDLANGRLYARNAAAALTAVDPEGKPVYEKNLAAYLTKIDELDGWVRDRIAAVPEGDRKILTSHDSFGYFGAAYGVQMLSPVGVSTEAEPSAKEVARLITQIRKEKITALFVENITDPRMVERIAKESGARMGGELYSDALSKPDGPAPTYLAMFKHNVTRMVAAMTGQ